MKNIILSLLLLVSLINASEEVPTQEEVAKLYVATFNRAPDKAGLDYWTNDSGLKLSKIAQSFFDQPETKALYPDGTSNADFITSVYQNLFNRTPDTDGLNYWENELNTGAFTKNRFIEAVINGAQNDDATILLNKTTVGLSFSEAGLSSVDDARTIMSGVNGTTESMSSAVTQFGITLFGSSVDAPTVVSAPTLISKTTSSIITKLGSFTDNDGVRNVTVKLYSYIDGLTTFITESEDGEFTTLSAGTTYFAVTSGEALNATTNEWESKSSPSALSVTTDSVVVSAGGGSSGGSGGNGL